MASSLYTIMKNCIDNFLTINIILTVIVYYEPAKLDARELEPIGRFGV